MTGAGKRSIMTLFCNKDDIYGHQIRIVLAEKMINYELEILTDNNVSEDLLILNPSNELPTLVDRELVLINAQIIMEYLDERFPHPPLMPVYPVERSRCRMTMYHIQNTWLKLVDGITKETDPAIKAKKVKQLYDEVVAAASIFAANTFFTRDEFSIIDCYIAPILWMLTNEQMNFDTAKCKPIKKYIDEVFKRPSFVQSIGNKSQRFTIYDKD